MNHEAFAKLNDEIKAKSKDLVIAPSLMDYLSKRINESDSFAEDVMNSKKSLVNCEKYIFNMARKASKKKNMACFADNVVFEWAEDYFRQEVDEDKVPEKPSISINKPMVIASPEKEKPKDIKPKEKKPEYQQMSLFDWLGGNE